MPSGTITRPASSSMSARAATITRCRATRCACSSTACAEVQRAMGFQNEKDHPEVAPSQFEINYGYAEVVAAADQIQLYKLICRQVATKMGLTAMLPAQAGRGRERQRHAHQRSITKNGKNLFWDPKGGEDEPVRLGVRRPHPDPRQRHLPDAEPQRQRLPPARSALRSAEPAQGFGHGSRLDGPHSHRQRAQRARGSPLRGSGRQSVHGAARSSRPASKATSPRSRTSASAERYLPDNIYDALANFNNAEWTTKLLGEDVKGRYADLKKASADRCPRLLGTFVKAPEVQYHHEVYNQFLWNMF